jgi:hypothetical protein
MPIREVAKYQQTFHGTTDDDEFSFAFYRVYKQNQKNKFRVRVVQISDFRAASVSNTPHAYFARDFANGFSTYSDETTGADVGVKSNDFCLGVVQPLYFGGAAQTATTGQTQFIAPEVVLDEISTSPFSVRYRHVGTDAFSAGNVGLLLVLEITEIEEVPY